MTYYLLGKSNITSSQLTPIKDNLTISKPDDDESILQSNGEIVDEVFTTTDVDAIQCEHIFTSIEGEPLLHS